MGLRDFSCALPINLAFLLVKIMANRRMFSKTIIRTDEFLDMPQSAQNLYFHLGIEADDDGFITPKMIMRTLGSTEDDLKVLIAKKFILPFNSGVIVIRHWKTHNYIQTDRYKPTIYKKEYEEICKDNVYILDTQVRLGKDRLIKKGSSSKKKKPYFRGNEMRESPVGSGKWWVIEDGQWLSYAGTLKEIEWR